MRKLLFSQLKTVFKIPLRFQRKTFSITNNNNNNLDTLKTTLLSIKNQNISASKENLEKSIKISDKALEKLKQIKSQRSKPDIYLRILVDGGGCSGFVYKLSLENDRSKITENDLVNEYDDELIVIDDISLGFLQGSTVEFVDSMIKSGFYIKENPTAEQSCSCGTSFTPNFQKVEKNKGK